MTRRYSGEATIDFDVKLGIEFTRRCGRGIWLAFLAIALLTVSFPSAGLTVDHTPSITSKLINASAIIRQDVPASLILDSRSKPGWSRTSERSGAFQPTGGVGIVPAGVRLPTSRPYPGTSRSVHDAIGLPRFRLFDAQAPPPRR